MEKEGLVDVNTGSYQEVIPCEGYNVVEWHPTQDGTGPATAICLVLPFKVGGVEANIMMRLKSRRAADELIGILEKHRNSVWPRD